MSYGLGLMLLPASPSAASTKTNTKLTSNEPIAADERASVTSVKCPNSQFRFQKGIRNETWESFPNETNSDETQRKSLSRYDFRLSAAQMARETRRNTTGTFQENAL